MAGKQTIEGFIAFRVLAVRDSPDGPLVDVELVFRDAHGIPLVTFPQRTLRVGDTWKGDYVQYAPAQLRITRDEQQRHGIG